MSRRLSRLTLFCLLALTGSSGCTAARYVSKTGDAGVVAIPADTDRWPYYHRRKAEELMRRQFPQGFEIEKEEEAVVGAVSQTSSTGGGPIIPFGPGGRFAFGVGASSGTIETTEKTEWRIHYRKR